MNDGENPQEPRFNPFGQPDDALERGKKLDLRQVFESYLKPDLQANQRKRKTIQAIDRHLRLFEEWWEAERAYWNERIQIQNPRAIIAFLSHYHLAALQRWLRNEGKSNRLINQTLGSVGQVLNCAEANGLIIRAPSVKALPAKVSAPKIYLNDEQLNALWNAAPSMRWPDRRRGFRGELPYSPGMAWRCCLVLWVMYGFRTQDLVALDSSATPITWGSVYTCRETPNPVGHKHNEWGWLGYIPSKERGLPGRDEPIWLPLNIYARAALEHLRPADWTKDMPICDWTFSSSSFYERWRELVQLAKIKSKTGDAITPKHLRKTCATRHELHRPGVSAYITGHITDPGGKNVLVAARSKVAERHYQNVESAVQECITTIALPSRFKEILQPPDMNA